MTGSGDTARDEAGLEAVAGRHGVGVDAVHHLREALRAGHGSMAQFDHPDLGGFGQWSAGGMVMVGRMFDDALKARVGALCTELARRLPTDQPASSTGDWWPADLGRPAASGAQDGVRYAFFPGPRRIAVESGGRLTLYDTGSHDIDGVAQRQGADAALRFTGRGGDIDLAALDQVEGVINPSVVSSPRGDAAARAGEVRSDPLALLKRLADLHREGVLTDEEFTAKKTDLLRRV